MNKICIYILFFTSLGLTPLSADGAFKLLFEDSNTQIKKLDLTVGESSIWLEDNEEFLILFTTDGMVRIYYNGVAGDVKVIKKNQVLKMDSIALKLQNIGNSKLDMIFIKPKLQKKTISN